MNSASSLQKHGRFHAAGLTGVNETNRSELMKLRLLHPQGTFELSYQCAGAGTPLFCAATASPCCMGPCWNFTKFIETLYLPALFKSILFFGLINDQKKKKAKEGKLKKKLKENSVGPVDLSGVMWTEPRVRRLKTMLVFGRVEPRVAMGNTCDGVSRRAATRGERGSVGRGGFRRVVKGC